jgi:hypothetical protein
VGPVAVFFANDWLPDSRSGLLEVNLGLRMWMSDIVMLGSLDYRIICEAEGLNRLMSKPCNMSR